MNRTKRVAKLECVRRPKPRLPQVVHIRHGESPKEAADRYERKYGQRPSRALGVPEPVTEENREQLERRCIEQQTRLLAEMRALSRNKEVKQ